MRRETFEEEYARRLRALCKAEGHVGRLPDNLKGGRKTPMVIDFPSFGLTFSSALEAADALGVSESHVRKHHHNGTLEETLSKQLAAYARRKKR